MIGIVGMGGSEIYELEKWGVLKATVTHFILSFSTFTIIAKTLGWLVPETALEMTIIYIMMVVGYVIIWLIQYSIYKREIRNINESLRKFKSNHVEI